MSCRNCSNVSHCGQILIPAPPYRCQAWLLGDRHRFLIACHALRARVICSFRDSEGSAGRNLVSEVSRVSDIWGGLQEFMSAEIQERVTCCRMAEAGQSTNLNSREPSTRAFGQVLPYQVRRTASPNHSSRTRIDPLHSAFGCAGARELGEGNGPGVEVLSHQMSCVYCGFSFGGLRGRDAR